MVRNGDEVELFIIGFIGDESEFCFQAFDLFLKFFNGMMLPKHLDNLLMREFVMIVITLSELYIVLQLSFVYLLLHLFTAVEGVF